MARTNTLGNFLTDVANAIRTKGGTSETIQASNFDTAIANLPSGGSFAPEYISFNGYTGATLTLTGLDTSNITNMKQIFYNCSNITSLDCSNWNTSNVTNISGMFYGCSKLTSLDVSGWNTSNVVSFLNMFNNCKKLTSLDLSSWTLTSCISTNYMFSRCSMLSTIDISNFDFTNVTTYEGMFNNVPTNCLIYVKDQTAKTWIETNFPIMTNVQIKE